jgi:hypothetical protein
VEGKDLDLLLKNLGNKISNHVSRVVLVSPPPETISEAPQVAESTSSSQEEQTTATGTKLNEQASEPATVAIAKTSPEQPQAAPETISESTSSVSATGSETAQENMASPLPYQRLLRMTSNLPLKRKRLKRNRSSWSKLLSQRLNQHQWLLPKHPGKPPMINHSSSNRKPSVHPTSP